MGAPFRSRSWGLGVILALVAPTFTLAGCGSSRSPSATRATSASSTTSTLPAASTSARSRATGRSVPPTSPSTTVPATGTRLAVGTNNPAEGDCTTNTSEATTSVGYVVLTVTASSFQAHIHLQTGKPNTTFGVFMQQVPGSCPQEQFNGGEFTTGSTGSGDFEATVPRVAVATTFFIQLVNGAINLEYTSDRISGVT